MSPPSNRTGFRPDAAAAAHGPGFPTIKTGLDCGTGQPGGERSLSALQDGRITLCLQRNTGHPDLNLTYQTSGFACSCHELKTSGAVHRSFIVKLSANWPTSNCCAVHHDSEYRAVNLT
jgi:hypothetical protein